MSTNCTNCPAERSHATARSAVVEPRGDVAQDAAGQRHVEEQRAVVGGDSRAQRQVDAQAAGDDPPAPGAAHGGQHGQADRGGERSGVDRAQAVEERARAEAPDQERQGRGGGGSAPTTRRSGSGGAAGRSSRQRQQVDVADADGEPTGGGLRQAPFA